MDKITIQRVKAGNEKLLNANKLPQGVINTLPNVPNSQRTETYQDTIEGISSNMKLNVHCNNALTQPFNMFMML